MVVPFSTRKLSFVLLLGTALFSFVFSGCETPATQTMREEHTFPPILTLSPGDAVEITFPGATNLTGVRRVGPEGTLTLPIVGAVQASGKTVAELETELEKRFENELRDKDVIVALAGSANFVYVSGSTMRPGRVPMDRDLTVMEAILEAGGFMPDANMKKVTVSRYEGDQNVTYSVNLQPLFEGGPVSRFYLKPRDVVYVPKKIQWF
jgi:protein involved in polysaccharide export with SLBB domain